MFTSSTDSGKTEWSSVQNGIMLDPIAMFNWVSAVLCIPMGFVRFGQAPDAKAMAVARKTYGSESVLAHPQCMKATGVTGGHVSMFVAYEQLLSNSNLGLGHTFLAGRLGDGLKRTPSFDRIKSALDDYLANLHAEDA